MEIITQKNIGIKTREQGKGCGVRIVATGLALNKIFGPQMVFNAISKISIHYC